MRLGSPVVPFFLFCGSGFPCKVKSQKKDYPYNTMVNFWATKVGTHHKSGSQLLRDVMRHAFDTLGAPVSCHYTLTPDHKSLPESFITSANHDSLCYDRMDIPIQWDNSAKIYNYQAAKGAATLQQLPIRGAHAVRKPKDMLISAYCYHHRGQEYGSPMAPWPEIMSMGPKEGLMAMWPVMSGMIQDMVDVHRNTSAEEMFPVRFEEITTSSEGFDDVVQRLFRFLAAQWHPFCSFCWVLGSLIM